MPKPRQTPSKQSKIEPLAVKTFHKKNRLVTMFAIKTPKPFTELELQELIKLTDFELKNEVMLFRLNQAVYKFMSLINKYKDNSNADTRQKLFNYAINHPHLESLINSAVMPGYKKRILIGMLDKIKREIILHHHSLTTTM